jgi:leucyl-tRNA synthetase
MGKVIDYLEDNGWGGRRVQHKLRDWLISRQRYWGAPIPVVYCDKCGCIPVPEDQLPVTLPEQVAFKGAGESPLLTNPDWVNTNCPECGGKGRREVDTMDTFVCSSWYYLRFVNPEIDSAAFDPSVVKAWLPVDQYVGGAEHAVMHLMYARFFAKVLHDLGYIDFDEPFTRLIHQGVITNQGAKMSKSRGNVVNPDAYIEKHGSDVFRMYLMFMGSYMEGGDWTDEGIHGMNRFVNRVWRLVKMIQASPPEGDEIERGEALERQRHYAVKKVTQDTDRFHFNTAISRIMELVNAIYLYIQDISPEAQNRDILIDALRTMIQLLAPFAPHLGEELWHLLGHKDSVFDSTWPTWDEAKLQTARVTVVVQVNGKLRSQIEANAEASEEEVRELAMADAKIQNYTVGKTIVKTIVVQNKLVNIVVK